VDEKKLVGLAFSGGGIRSATFGLGVLEGLKKLSLLNQVHYLSTVSGGGYIGGWFSANCRRARDRGDVCDWRSSKAEWSRSMQYLRDYSNYLSPDIGFFSADTWVDVHALVPERDAGPVDDRDRGRLRPAPPEAGRLRLRHLAHGRPFALDQRRPVHRQHRRHCREPPAGEHREAEQLAEVAPAEGARLVTLIVAGLLVVGGYCLLPAALAVYDRLAKPRYTEVNYGQTHVQWSVRQPRNTARAGTGSQINIVWNGVDGF
jgi:hypothetical protein